MMAQFGLIEAALLARSDGHRQQRTAVSHAETEQGGAISADDSGWFLVEFLHGRRFTVLVFHDCGHLLATRILVMFTLTAWSQILTHASPLLARSRPHV
jgi:hypothetical protein